MIASSPWPMVATATFQRLVYCLAEGMALAVLVAGVLRLAPGRDSGTRFRLRFAALLATAALPLLTAALPLVAGDWQSLWAVSGAPRSVVSIPVTVVEWACAAWLLIAMLGLLRVSFGLRQIHRLRQACERINPTLLGPELVSRVAEFSKLRRVAILVSQEVHVPAAIGFFKPAIVLPAWLVADGPSSELKHVLLHELEHLRRFDDWTNLAQQVVKAILFFHPAVWWMERELSLDREMACDDAVLAHSASPRAYAECLARVAEKSFLQRQMALAQAAVSRARQLSHRVARILDPARPAAARLWKPAIPVVAALAVLCAFSLSWTPGLIAVNSGAAVATTTASPAVTTTVATAAALPRNARPADASINPAKSFANSGRVTPASLRQSPYMRPVAMPAALRTTAAPARQVPAKTIVRPSHKQRPVLRSQGPADKGRIAALDVEDPLAVQARLAAMEDIAASLKSKHGAGSAPVLQDKSFSATEAAEGDYVLVVATEQTVTQGPAGTQVKVVQVRLLVPASEFKKQFPKKI